MCCSSWSIGLEPRQLMSAARYALPTSRVHLETETRQPARDMTRKCSAIVMIGQKLVLFFIKVSLATQVSTHYPFLHCGAQRQV
jgi:hypothetical protein